METISALFVVVRQTGVSTMRGSHRSFNLLATPPAALLMDWIKDDPAMRAPAVAIYPKEMAPFDISNTVREFWSTDVARQALSWRDAPLWVDREARLSNAEKALGEALHDACRLHGFDLTRGARVRPGFGRRAS